MLRLTAAVALSLSLCSLGGAAAAGTAAAPARDDALLDPATASVRFVANTGVHAAPSATAPRIGVAGKDARTRALAAAPAGSGCAQRWIAIAPRGWVCAAALATSAEPPTAPSVISLHADDEPELGAYGAVRGADTRVYASREDIEAGGGRAITGALSVRRLGVALAAGERYWITAQGWIAERAIIGFAPSQFHGAPLDDGELHVAWARSARDPRAPVVLRGAPRTDAEITGEVSPRARLHATELSPDGRWVRVGEADWVARADVRLAQRAAPPPGTAATEKWFDVDLDEQILVAYEGERPVYATLVSTGRWDHRTPEGIARVASKLRLADMTSTQGDLYSVADVPWTMFYDEHFALHTSYWHDGFGAQRSHGCVNLAPRDARVLFAWSSPDVPPGWVAVYGDADAPGSLVRVRSRAVPAPPFRGYARALHERATQAEVAAR